MGEYDKLGLYYPAKLAGFDGEMFHYAVSFDKPVTNELEQKVADAIHARLEPMNAEEGTYTGDFFFYGGETENQMEIELDLGNARPATVAHENQVINSILLALNTVPGIREVVINEGCDDFM